MGSGGAGGAGGGGGGGTWAVNAPHSSRDPISVKARDFNMTAPFEKEPGPSPDIGKTREPTSRLAEGPKCYCESEPGAPLPVFFLATARTPIGAFGGSLRGLATADLATRAMQETLRRADVAPDRIQEVILGCALAAGCGDNPARQAAQEAGIDCPAFSINMGAGSGLKSIILAAQTLSMGTRELVLAGGAESASRAPYLIPDGRWGTRMGSVRMLDSLLVDGGYGDLDPLATSEEAASAWEERSWRKAQESLSQRQRELFPICAIGRRGSAGLAADEAPRSARISFRGHCAAPADGAAMLLLGSCPTTPSQGRLLGVAETDLGWHATIRKLLANIGLSFTSVDRWELHEASDGEVMSLLAEMPEVNPSRVNVRGGALALGDPCGASGARLLISLLHTLQDEGLETGVVSLPAGRGLFLALAITRT